MSKFLNFDKNKYLVKYDIVNRACLSIIKSREMENENHQQQKDKINDLLGKLFLENLDVQIFILTEDLEKQKNSPISFVVFTSNEKGVWNEEMIYTHKNYSNACNAERLFKHAFNHLKEIGAKEVNVAVANRNGRGTCFHTKMLATFAEGSCDNAKMKAEDENDLHALKTGYTHYNFDLSKEFKENKTSTNILTSAAITSAKSAVKENKIEKI